MSIRAYIISFQALYFSYLVTFIVQILVQEIDGCKKYGHQKTDIISTTNKICDHEKCKIGENGLASW